jgi:acetyl esterase
MRQPYRSLFGVIDRLVRLGLAPGPEAVMAKPMAKRLRVTAPAWSTRRGDRSVRSYDQTIASRGGPLALRIYVKPHTPPRSPGILYIHGGGFIAGGLDAGEYLCRELASRTGYPVVSVQYRLSPECPFPGPLEDCGDALSWMASTRPEDIDPGRLAVVGDSSGGNLAAALCLLTRDQDGPKISHQTLVYPFTDGSISSGDWETFAYCGVDRDAGHLMMRTYAPDHSADEPLVSVLDAPSHAGLPPALVITAERDVLNYDGAEYARRLERAGVPTVHVDFAGLPHGFIVMPRLSRDADAAIDLICGHVTGRFDRT